MAKQTLLSIVQEILSAMSSDEVNSISDSPESLQVARIVQRKYYDISTRGGLPDDNELVQLVNSNDATKPTLMFIPSGLSKVEWVKYYDSNPLNSSTSSIPTHGVNVDIIANNPLWATSSTTSITMGLGTKTFTVANNNLNVAVGQNIQAVSGSNSLIGTLQSYSGFTMVITVTSMIGSGTFSSWAISSFTSTAPGYKYVTVLPVAQFLDLVNEYILTNSNVNSWTFNEAGYNFNLNYLNDQQPKYCTILSNFYVLFNSFDNTQDTTLQGSKTLVYGQTVPAFSLADSFIPDMDDNQFPLLINESKALAFYELKQQPHAKAEQEIKRQWSTIQKNKFLIDRPSYFDSLPNFGRVTNTGGYGGRAIVKLREPS